MKISVIIPSYKPKEYINECLASLGQQTLGNRLFEIIIVLNGCCEPWYAQINELCNKLLSNNIVHIIQTDQGGVSNARNIALNIAEGEYIAFIDDDDYISPNYLEELLKYSTDRCVALSDSIYVHDKGKNIDYDNPHHRNFEKNKNSNHSTLFGSRVYFNGPCMKLIHRSIIGDKRFNPNFKNGEDNLMMFGISNKISKIKFTSEKAIYYRRIRENSATTTKSNKKEVFWNSVHIMREYCKYLKANPFKYNSMFVLSRFAAEIKSILIY